MLLGDLSTPLDLIGNELDEVLLGDIWLMVSLRIPILFKASSPLALCNPYSLQDLFVKSITNVDVRDFLLLSA